MPVHYAVTPIPPHGHWVALPFNISSTMATDTRSSADSAFERFKEIIAARVLFQVEEKSLSESDTRVKFIDPLFKKVLGWREAEIRREKPVEKGFVDYVLGSDFAFLLIEAKRAIPRFQLTAPGKPRRLKLSGPHLLGNRKVKPAIVQAQGYASSLGVQFCIVTNGTQLIVFKPYLPGRAWDAGEAIVFHDHKDIEQHFAEFHQLLSREQVVSGSLVEAFDQFERTTVQLHTVLGQIPDPDRELVRNPVWQQISRIMTPLLTDRSEDPAAQLEVIENCYVTTRLADQTDASLDALIQDVPPQYLLDARVIDLKPGVEGKTAFSHRIDADVKMGRPGSYILTGGVGSGKTTFLRRFAAIVAKDFVERYTVWIHIDFLAIGNVEQSQLDIAIQQFVYRELRRQLEANFVADLFATGEQVRLMFKPEIDAARLTRLYGVVEGTPEWNTGVNAIVEAHFNDDAKFSLASMRVLRNRGRRVVMVLDNTDQFGEALQEKLFLFSQRLSADFGALCIVSLREEKFFAAHRRGIFDAYNDTRFHIGSADLRRVLQKRLEYGRRKFKALAKKDEANGIMPADLERIDALLRVLIQSTTQRNHNIVRMLASVSNGDMRHALDMFKEFLSSGNTNIDKIIAIVQNSGGYTVPFHEFAKSAILGSRRYYRSSASKVVNLFKQSDALGASHLTACRILARLSAAEGAASAHGEGYVAVSDLLREYRDSFGYADDLVQWVGALLRNGLLESEPPKVGALDLADALRITASGAYYWRYLVRSFAYIDLVFMDTPMADRTVVKKLATMATMSDLTVRFERVRAFLEYLERKEGEELAGVAARGGPFVEPLARIVREQVEREIRVISKGVGVPDRFGAS